MQNTDSIKIDSLTLKKIIQDKEREQLRRKNEDYRLLRDMIENDSQFFKSEKKKMSTLFYVLIFQNLPPINNTQTLAEIKQEAQEVVNSSEVTKTIFNGYKRFFLE